MISAVPSASLAGVEGRPVWVEVHVSSGLPGFTVVGLPDTAVRESRDRVRAALLSSGLPWPLRRVTVNLAPSGTPKRGAGLDLPIAVALLVASGVVPTEAVAGLAFVGELGLDGSLRSVPGALSLVECLAGSTVVVPDACAAEARLFDTVPVQSAGSLRQVVDGLLGTAAWTPEVPLRPEGGPCGSGAARDVPDLADVRGQPVGRFALEVAAAGGHHLLFVGPPGTGKTMLARRLPGLLPPMPPDVAAEACRIRSAAGLGVPAGRMSRLPPFRAPHHSASAVSLVGGGAAWMRPGEISLAHGGVLFLDEMGEFPASVLDMLRQPLEDGVISVSRARGTVTFPARFLLVGATNPCPCGEGGPPGSCRCSDAARARYGRRLSGPVLDRFDLVVPLARPAAGDLLGGPPGESSATVAGRVAHARAMAAERGVPASSALGPAALDRHAPLSSPASRLLEARLRSGELSGRGLQRVRRVARTVADLAGSGGLLGEEHVAAALALRASRAVLVPEGAS